MAYPHFQGTFVCFFVGADRKAESIEATLLVANEFAGFLLGGWNPRSLKTHVTLQKGHWNPRRGGSHTQISQECQVYANI